MKMQFNQVVAIILGCYLLLCNSIATGSKELQDHKVVVPPLIFPTDKHKNNIVPINKTAMEILLEHDNAVNEGVDNNRSTQIKYDKDATLEESPSEVIDLIKTDERIAQEDYRPIAASTIRAPSQRVAKYRSSPKDDAEDMQGDEENEIKDVIELEERYHRSSQTDFIRRERIVASLETHHGVEHSHIAWISISIVVFLGFAIYVVLVFWRTRLERRYGHRHRLVAEESFHELTL